MPAFENMYGDFDWSPISLADEETGDFSSVAWEQSEIRGAYQGKKDGLDRPLPSFCLKVPTGGGKTFLAVRTARSRHQRHTQRYLILPHFRDHRVQVACKCCLDKGTQVSETPGHGLDLGFSRSDVDLADANTGGIHGTIKRNKAAGV